MTPNVWKMFTNSQSTLTFCPVTKNDLSWLNNLFVARFQLIRMSSYAKNKLQMCSVTQHQCRRRQMCGKVSQIHPVHSLFVRYKNDLSWLNNLFMARFQLIRNPLMLGTNYRCVQSLNISVDVAKCVEMFPINSPSTLTFVLLQKKWLVFTEQSIHGKVSTH